MHSMRHTSDRSRCRPAEFGVEALVKEGKGAAGQRQVYKLLRAKDIKPGLEKKTLHILWPDDGKWYAADIEEVRGAHVAAAGPLVGLVGGGVDG